MSLFLRASSHTNATPLFTSTIVVSIPRKQKHRFSEPKKQDFAYGLQLTVKVFVIVIVNVKVEMVF
jgi:hypothetical protein